MDRWERNKVCRTDITKIRLFSNFVDIGDSLLSSVPFFLSHLEGVWNEAIMMKDHMNCPI